MNKKRGKFIVFEGLDGAGKTSQIQLLAESISQEGGKVSVTAEPTNLESGRAIREILSGKVKKSPYELAVMFVQDRIAHNIAEEGIENLLASGYDVICDRYYFSNLAYQGYLTDYDWVKSMNLGCPKILPPDICIFLDLEPWISLERIGGTRAVTDIYENLETLTRVRESFERVIADLQDSVRIVKINTDAPKETVKAAIYDIYKSIK